MSERRPKCWWRWAQPESAHRPRQVHHKSWQGYENAWYHDAGRCRGREDDSFKLIVNPTTAGETRRDTHHQRPQIWRLPLPDW